MSAIEFHFGAPSKLDYACRLLRKAAGSGARVLVVANEETLQALDAGLWATSPTDFVAHCVATADAFVQQQCPVVLTTHIGHAAVQPEVLLNLSHEVPMGFDQFGRVIEVVSTDDADRDLARARWRSYAQQGYTISRRDLALKGAG